jgi:hypothetical protein
LFRNPEEGQGSQRAVMAVMMMMMIPEMAGDFCHFRYLILKVYIFIFKRI